MKSVLTFAATAMTAMSISAAAQAATFDFSFYVVEGAPVCNELQCPPPEYTDVGTGTISYDGEAVFGEFALSALSNLEMSFTVGGSTFTDEDDFLGFGLPVLSVYNLNGLMRAAFADSPPPIDQETEIDIRLVEIEQPFNCFGSFSILNDAGDCLNFGRGLVMRPSEMEALSLSPFSMIPGEFAEEQGRAAAMPVSIFGRYIGRPADDMAAVPLPASLPLLAFAIGGMGYLRSRRG